MWTVFHVDSGEQGLIFFILKKTVMQILLRALFYLNALQRFRTMP